VNEEDRYPECQWRVEGMSLAGEPIDPPSVCTKFQNAIGALIRTEYVVDPSIPNWFEVPEGLKSEMWVNSELSHKHT
jgi:hypothetical protein